MRTAEGQGWNGCTWRSSQNNAKLSPVWSPLTVCLWICTNLLGWLFLQYQNGEQRRQSVIIPSAWRLLRHRASSFPTSWRIWHLALWQWRNKSRQKKKKKLERRKRNLAKWKTLFMLFFCCPFLNDHEFISKHILISEIVVLSPNCPRVRAASHLIYFLSGPCDFNFSQTWQHACIAIALCKLYIHVWFSSFSFGLFSCLIHSQRLWTPWRWTVSFMYAYPVTVFYIQ